MPSLRTAPCIGTSCTHGGDAEGVRSATEMIVGDRARGGPADARHSSIVVLRLVLLTAGCGAHSRHNRGRIRSTCSRATSSARCRTDVASAPPGFSSHDADVEALEESAFLLTIAWPGRDHGAARSQGSGLAPLHRLARFGAAAARPRSEGTDAAAQRTRPRHLHEDHAQEDEVDDLLDVPFCRDY